MDPNSAASPSPPVAASGAEAAGSARSPDPAAETGLAPSLGRGAALVLLCSFLPLLAAFLVNLWGRPLYRFFPLALAGALVLAWQAWRRLPEELEAGSRSITFAWMGLALALLIGGTVFWSPWTGALGMWCALAGVLWWVGGWGLFAPLLPTLLLLLTLIPPPMRLDTDLFGFLAWATARASSRLLYELDLPHVLTPSGMEMPRLSLAAGDLVRPLEGFLAVCVFGWFWVLLRRRGWWPALLTLVMAAVAAWLGTVAAMTLGVKLSLAYHYNCFEGARGTMFGIGVFAVGGIVVLSFDQLLRFLTTPLAGVADPALQPARPAALAPWTRHKSARPARMLAGVFAVCGVLQGPSWWLAYTSQREALEPPASALRREAAFELPAQAGEWKRVAAPATLAGELAGTTHTNRQWYFELGQLTATVSLDAPFKGYSDLVGPYAGAGWRVYRLEERRVALPGPSCSFEVQMQRQLTQFGWLRFGQFDEAGKWLGPPANAPTFLGRFRAAPKPPTAYRVQLLVVALEPLAEKERAAAEALWNEMSQSLRNQVLAQLEKR